MTIIAAIKEENVIHMACDKQATTGWHKEQVPTKLIKRDGMLMGIAGLVRVFQTMQHTLQIPRYHPEDSAEQYLVSQFIPALQANLLKQQAISDEKPLSWSCEGLLGFQDKVFYIGSDFSIVEQQKLFCACGSGSEYALGSLHTTNKYDLNPKERLQLAIKAAGENDIFCNTSMHYNRITDTTKARGVRV